MDTEFWHARWRGKQIGFHEAAPNGLLVPTFPRLFPSRPARVFVPLCGKTRDIGWLASQGVAVVGAELSEIAVAELFDELGATPEIRPVGPLRRYCAGPVSVYAGDIFELTANELGPVDLIYDRAALVALPDGLRDRYAGTLRELTQSTPQLLVAFGYDPALMDAPPFSVPEHEVRRLYGAHYEITSEAQREVTLKGTVPATEVLWHLQPKGA